MVLNEQKHIINLNNLYNRYNNNLIDLKNDYNLIIIFHKKNYSFKNILYKKIFRSKYSHISLILDYKYKIEISFENGTKIKNEDYELIDIIDFDINFNKILDLVKIKLNLDEYNKILNLFNLINNKKYDYFSIFKNLFNNNLLNKNKYICTEIVELILNNIDIKINNRYNVENLYNKLIENLKLNNKSFVLI